MHMCINTHFHGTQARRERRGEEKRRGEGRRRGEAGRGKEGRGRRRVWEVLVAGTHTDIHIHRMFTMAYCICIRVYVCMYMCTDRIVLDTPHTLTTRYHVRSVCTDLFISSKYICVRLASVCSLHVCFYVYVFVCVCIHMAYPLFSAHYGGSE